MIRDIYIEGIGNVKMKKGNQYKNIKISVRPFSKINVSVPLSLPFTDAEQFVMTKKDWIKQSMQKLKKIENRLTLFDENSELKTRDHTLKLSQHSGNTIKLIIKNGIIYVFYPQGADVKDQRIQKAVRIAIVEAWRIEARKYLPQRVEYFARLHGFSYRKITVKNAGTRWGSCSSVNNLNFNVQLMRLPQHLCDYVILHELAHTVEKNHGKGFWSLLEKVSGNAKAFDKELKNYSLKVW
jgi:predicted metal-dependent hydrolase